MTDEKKARIETCLYETRDHIAEVGWNLSVFIAQLSIRIKEHDKSKLEEPELSIYAEVTPRLKGLTYGSEEYTENLKDLSVALDHHYKHNSHHPEHYENGIEGMDLVDLVEMFCDWKAAAERHDDGDIMRSIEINEKRFNIPPQLSQIFRNTVEKHFRYRFNASELTISKRISED